MSRRASAVTSSTSRPTPRRSRSVPATRCLRDRVRLRDVTFVRTPPANVLVQMRAHAEPFPATLDGDTVMFDEPQSRVSPGQVVACYDGDVLLGGGIAAE